MNLLPRDPTFFKLFDELTAVTREASEILATSLNTGFANVCSVHSEIQSLEKHGDVVVQSINRRLEETFLWPFEPLDIKTLATALDDVLDGIENMTFRVVAYKLQPIPAELVDFAQIVRDCCIAVEQALKRVAREGPVADVSIAISQLEEQADLLERRLLTKLFHTEIDPILLLKYKELYEMAEGIADRCDDIANLLVKVAVKP